MDSAHHIFNLKPRTAYVVIVNGHALRAQQTWFPEGQVDINLDLNPGDRVTFIAVDDTTIATGATPLRFRPIFHRECISGITRTTGRTSLERSRA